MSMIVQHNMSAMNANRMLGVTTSAQSKSTEKLSSGYKINRAADDAAGLAISEKMRGQIRGLNKASDNAQDGISLIQTAEGALTESHSILQRMRELAVQASSDTNTDDDRVQIQNEIEQLTSEIDRIAGTTEFNTKKLLDGSRTGSVSQKDGTASVEGTFSNSNVSAAITTDNAASSSFTEVARIEIMSDFKEGMSTKGTAKYTDAELDAAYNNLAVTTNTTLSSDELIAKALKDAESTLKNNKTSYDTSVDDVSANADAVASYFEGSDLKTSLGLVLEDGKTVEDVEKAVNALADAYVTQGVISASDKSEAVKAAEKALEDLFIAGNTTDKLDTTVAQVTDPTIVGTTKTVTTLTATTANTTTTKAHSDAAKATLKSLAICLADVKLSVEKNKTSVDEAQKDVDILSNTDLMKSKIDYELAKTDEGNAAAGSAEKAEAQARMDAAQAKIDSLNVDQPAISLTDLFGNTSDITKFTIDDNVADDGSLKITLKNGSGDKDTVITIANADKLKAGDVITITSEAMVETKPAATGKDALRLQVGANAGQEVMLGINSMKAKDLNIVQTKEGKEGAALDVTSQANASLAINAYDMAIKKVSTERSKMGAVQNRLEHTISNLDTAAENTQNAESRIRDTDMADEMVEFSKNNILSQAGQSMLAQANQSNQGVLSLLQ